MSDVGSPPTREVLLAYRCGPSASLLVGALVQHNRCLGNPAGKSLRHQWLVFGGDIWKSRFMRPPLQKLALTAHIIFSVGWLGAVVAYLPLAIAALTSAEIETVRTSCIAMERIGWFAILPLCIASLLSGLFQSIATEWGLLRHYWVAAKLVLTFISTAILLAHLPVISRMAAHVAAVDLPLLPPDVQRAQLVVHAAGGLLMLAAITAISVLKPWGRIRFGPT